MTATARTYTKVARAASEERTRTALLDAAEEAFFAKRWHEISLEAVARRAGVSKQTLLRHFGSKEGLLEHGFRRAFDRVRAQRMVAPTDDIEGAVDNLLAHYDEYGERALKMAAMDGDGAVAEVGRAARELHYDWVDQTFGTWLRAARGKRRGRLRSALIALCDVQTWAILSRDLALPRAEVRATLIVSIRRLLEEES
jgi:AcrR family transcriptional regulator